MVRLWGGAVFKVFVTQARRPKFDLGANLKNKTNKQVTGVVVYGCNLHAGEAETVESLGFTGPGSLIGERRSVKLFQKSWCLKNNT